MNKLLKNWKIGTVSAIEPISSYWGKTSLVITTDGKYFILKEKHSLSQAMQEFNLLSKLSNAGAPVAVPVRLINGEHFLLVNERTYCLYPKLPGKVVEEHYAGSALERARSFGKAIAFLHSCLLMCENIGDIPELKLIEQIQEWAIPCIRKNGEIVDGYTVEETWNAFEQEMVQLEDDLPKQLIHRDLHPANMLFENGGLTGFVDFDMIVSGFRIFDVCYCATSILVGGFQDSAKREK